MHKQNINKKQTLTEIVFLIIFFMLLTLPLFQQLFKLFRFEPLDENRVKASAPTLSDLQTFSSFRSKLEAYLLDSFGFRDELIRLKHEIDFRIFHKSDKVLIDKSGRLFPEYFEYYRGEIANASDQQWNDVFHKFKQINNKLKKQHTQLLVVFVPLADSIYPEQFSVLQNAGFDTTYYGKLEKYFDQEGINYINVEHALEANKEKPLYYYTDFHYTQVGSFITMKEMLNTLYPLANIKKNWNYPLEYDYSDKDMTDGVLSKYLGMFTQVHDKVPVVKQQWKSCSRPITGGYETICKDNLLLPHTAIFGNSFMGTMLGNGFPDEFTKLDVHLIANLSKEINDIPKDTKIVIIQTYELNMYDFLYKDMLPPLDTN